MHVEPVMRGLLEGVDLMRLEPEGLPDPADGRFRQPSLGGHRCSRPMRGILGGPLQCGHHHRLDLLVGHRARPSRARLVDQPIQPAFHKQPTPHAHRLRPNPDFAGDLLVWFPAAQLNTIRHRCANACDDVGRRACLVPLKIATDVPRLLGFAIQVWTIPAQVVQIELQFRRPAQSARVGRLAALWDDPYDETFCSVEEYAKALGVSVERVQQLIRLRLRVPATSAESSSSSPP